MKFDDWVCLESGEDDYVIDHFEVRVKGKKPLVLKKPSYSKLLFVTQQYLNLSISSAKYFISQSVLESPDPICFDEYWRMRDILEKHLAK